MSPTPVSRPPSSNLGLRPHFNVTDNPAKTATDTHQVMCIYPISGQYSLLPRLLYYALLIFTITVRHQTWLRAGAAAAALTYAGAAAVHAFVLATVSKGSLLDLDVITISLILGAGLVACVPMLLFSDVVKKSGMRTVLGLWSILAAIGAICSYVVTFRSHPQETECRSNDNTLLTGTAQLHSAIFNCTYECFSTHQILRAPSEIAVVATQRVADPGFMFVPCGVVSCLVGVVLYRVEQRAGRWTETRPVYLLGFRAAFAGLFAPGFGLMLTVLPIELIIIYRNQLPTSEKPYAVGQWTSWVSIALVLAAAVAARWQWLRRLFGDDVPQDPGSNDEGSAYKTYQGSAETGSSFQVTDDHDIASPNRVAMRAAPITFRPYNKEEDVLKHNTADLTRVHESSDKDPELAIGAVIQAPPARRNTH